MKGRPIDHLVYECMFPKPKPGDPQSFHDFLRRQLVPEVRSETACFYGGLDSLEAQYPGLDYSYPPHRMRLGRYTWHRRLFRAFDNLKLTPSEIASLTKWEGTRWARERYEKEHNLKIRDTTGDCIHDWVDPELRRPSRNPDISYVARGEKVEAVEHGEATEEIEDDGDESDMEIDSVGVELNERLRAAAALREAGNASTVMDEEWEQWLKDAVEAGGIPSLANYTLPVLHNSTTTNGSSASMPPRLLNAARLGQWQQIPEFVQDMVRQNIELHNSELVSRDREYSPQVPGSISSRNGSANIAPTVQHRHGTSSMRRLSYHSQTPARSLRSHPQSWQERFQQEESR